jgi:hypothetical protein
VVPGAFVGTMLLPLNPFRKSVYGKKSSVGQGWDVVAKYISGRKGYEEIGAARGEGESGERGGEKTGVMPVVEIRVEKAKTHKTWYMTLYEKIFGGKQLK